MYNRLNPFNPRDKKTRRAMVCTITNLHILHGQFRIAPFLLPNAKTAEEGVEKVFGIDFSKNASE